MTSLSILDSESSYAKHRQRALGLINQLRAIGAQADLDLPRIAVIGNQSAGKSSLVEAISGINVPRDAGTCTRCPFECRLSYSPDEWHCKISIRWEFDSDGVRRDEVREEQFGEVITTPEDVEIALRRVQTAVLNPGQSIRQFLDMRVDELKRTRPNQLSFSRNAICVDLSGPQMADLAFVDLPGIVQNADDKIVKLVEELVKSHISHNKGNCLILATLPMSDDIENQKAMRLAREADPLCLRTIGVLTKPDLVKTTQQKNLWLDVLEGRRHTLKHGYYCTRQPDEDDRAQGMNAAQARLAEEDYFHRTHPWVESAEQSRLGTPNLVSNLSRLLSKLIDERLPTLSKETTRILTDCDNRLGTLPPPITSEPSAFVLNLITSFCNTVRSHVQGQPLATEFVQETLSTYKTFKVDIRATAPRFIPLEDQHWKRMDLNQDMMDVMKIDDDGTEQDGTLLSWSVPEPIYLKDVRKRIAMAVTRELPNNVPYSVKLFFIRDFQKAWEKHVQKCVTEIHRTVQRRFTDLVHEHFGSYIHLEPHIQHVVSDLIQSTYKAANAQLAKVLKFETTAFTQNEHYLSASKQGFSAQYKALRSKAKTGTGGGGAQPVSPAPAPVPTSRSSSSPWKPLQPVHGSPSECPGSGIFHGFSVAESDNGTARYNYKSISADPFYVSWSFEELRVKDYQSGRKPIPFTFGPLATPSPQAVGPSQLPVPLTPTPISAVAPAPTAAHTPAVDRSQQEAGLLAALAQFGVAGLSVSDVLGKLNPADEYEVEIEVMAEVRAYFKVAYKRVIDYVPLTIDHEFLFALVDALQDRLIEKLGLGTDGSAERCKGYLAEDFHVVATREELLSRKKRLEKIQKQLLNFGL